MLKTMASTLALLAFGTAASAAEPPYLKLAQALGTPNLVNSSAPTDKSQMQLQFGKDGETQDTWTKQTSVSIVKVPVAYTQQATLDAITNLAKVLNSRHVHVDTFEAAKGKPYSCYFEYHVGTERDKGVAYSPHSGFVTIAQVAAKSDDAITKDDVLVLKAVIGR